MLRESIMNRLVSNPQRKRLLNHPFLARMTRSALTFDGVGVVLGQWWHPLHYFPTFLARVASVVPLAEKVAVAKILYQELGEGEPSRAHESVFLATMTALGFPFAVLTSSAPLDGTRRLVERYEESSASCPEALGFLYATEVADLAMVAGIGAAVRRVTGASDLPWVDIHVLQEPEHVDKARDAVALDLSEAEAQRLVAHAEESWALWAGFFTSLQETTRETHAPVMAP